MNISSRLLLVSASALLVSANRADSATLVYEGFTGYTVGAALGTGVNANPNSNTTGLDTGSAWQGSGIGNFTYVNSGMTFGALQTSGGAVTFASGNTAVAAAKMAITNFTGTLYSSYLVNLTVFNAASGGMLTRVADNNTSGGERLAAFADTRTGTATSNLETRYSSPGGVLASSSLASDTDYLLISRFTGVGGSTSRSSTLYALTLAQFSSMLASPDSQSYLDTAVVGTAPGEITGRVGQTGTADSAFDNGNYAQFLSVADAGTFDEYRYGDSLASVIPVPEPTTVGLILISILPILRRKRIS